MNLCDVASKSAMATAVLLSVLIHDEEGPQDTEFNVAIVPLILLRDRFPWFASEIEALLSTRGETCASVHCQARGSTSTRMQVTLNLTRRKQAQETWPCQFPGSEVPAYNFAAGLLARTRSCQFTHPREVAPYCIPVHVTVGLDDDEE